MELPMKTITLTLNWREYDELAEHVGELLVPGTTLVLTIEMPGRPPFKIEFLRGDVPDPW
jgi:hypothetical protein